MVEKGRKIGRDLAMGIGYAGVRYVYAYGLDKDKEDVVTKIIGNNFVDLQSYVNFDISELKLADKAFYPVLREILDSCQTDDEIRTKLKERKHDLSPKHIIIEDIIASIS